MNISGRVFKFAPGIFLLYHRVKPVQQLSDRFFEQNGVLWYNFPMIELDLLRDEPAATAERISRRGVMLDIDRFKTLDSRRRELIMATESMQAEKNKLARETGCLKKDGREYGNLAAESTRLASELEKIKVELKIVEEEFRDFLLSIPNLPDDSVPAGKSAADNIVLRSWGDIPLFDFLPRAHWEIESAGGRLDFSRAGKIAGSRFALSFGSLARLERALISFMLDVHSQENGYTEVCPPFLVNGESLLGTGNLPKFKDDLFKVENHGFYLVPTAEVPLTNIHRDEVLQAADLPRRYVAYTPCFRSEAGSHGRDIRGLIRLHQFNKVEMMTFSMPAESAAELDKMTKDAETILRRLELPYRTMLLCGADMSFAAAKTHDIEVWMPARNDYLEISSCSNTGSFQARRCRIKYRGADGKKDFLHTLNGSGLAVGRTIAAILENHQTASGLVKIPKALQEYFPGQEFF